MPSNLCLINLKVSAKMFSIFRILSEAWPFSFRAAPAGAWWDLSTLRCQPSRCCDRCEHHRSNQRRRRLCAPCRKKLLSSFGGQSRRNVSACSSFSRQIVWWAREFVSPPVVCKNHQPIWDLHRSGNQNLSRLRIRRIVCTSCASKNSWLEHWAEGHICYRKCDIWIPRGSRCHDLALAPSWPPRRLLEQAACCLLNSRP